jgi:hypothetical protein
VDGDRVTGKHSDAVTLCLAVVQELEREQVRCRPCRLVPKPTTAKKGQP